MNNQNRNGRVKVATVRTALAELSDAICSGAESVKVSFSGNSFHFHLEGATVNITVSERPAAQKGGQK